MKQFKVGSYIHNGYCRAKILRESEYKGYAYVIKLEPTDKDPIGARKLYGKVMHVSYVAVLYFKDVK